MKMSTIISILSIVILSAILFFIMSKTSISFKPFSFELTEPLRGAGWLLLIIGISFIEYSSYKRCKDQILTEAHNNLTEIDKMQKECKDVLNKLKEKDGK